MPGMMGMVLLALLPAVFTFFFFSGWNAVRITAIALVSCLLSQWGARKIFGKPASLYDGSAAVTAILLSLLLPPTLPSVAVALGSFSAIVVGKEIFGGLGQNPFNPALVGAAVLWASFPFAGMETQARATALFLGGVLLIWKRLISWEVPLLYLGSLFAFSWVLRPSGGEIVFSGAALLAAFFLVTDPVTTPLTREGMRWFAFGAGLFSAFFREGTNSSEAVTYSILLMNSLNPWLDRNFRPRRAKLKSK